MSAIRHLRLKLMLAGSNDQITSGCAVIQDLFLSDRVNLTSSSIMPLQPGDKLGPYEIVVPIGAGGMGEVYKAKDTKLDREVGIKVLPSALAQDPERLARFGEAKVLASLNHPNIAQIYGIEESSTGSALVMELVPGEMLKGPFPLEAQ